MRSTVKRPYDPTGILAEYDSEGQTDVFGREIALSLAQMRARRTGVRQSVRRITEPAATRRWRVLPVEAPRGA